MTEEISAEPTLLDRRRLQMKDDLARVAVELFTIVGFDETSMEQIAETAGVSRRTVYRHFPTKADLVFEHPRRWLELFESILGNPEPGENARQSCERGITEVAKAIASDPEPVLKAFAVRNENPILGATHASSDRRWAELILMSLLGEHGEDRLLECMVCAGSLIGATNALILSWSMAYPHADLAAMTEATLDQISSLWPEPS